jgi:hypothetical protein
MIKRILIFCFCSLLYGTSEATEQILMYHVSKQVHWLHDGKKETARRGVFLLLQHRLLITPQSSIMLVNKDGKSMLLDKPGTYTFTQLRGLIERVKAESVSKKFFSYVFEKFLSGEGDEKQKVAAVVYRGKKVMISPVDSSFYFKSPVLSWKPDNTSIPYKIEINTNHELFDTVLRKQTSLVLPERFLRNKPLLIQWSCHPADSKQKPRPFIFLIPRKEDVATIQQQLNSLKKNYNNNPALLKIMKADLFRHWVASYELQ